MARIPDFTAVGFQSPQPIDRRVPVDQSGEMIGRGVEELAGAVRQAGDMKYAQQQRMLAAKGENAILDHQLAVQQLAETTRQQIASGDLDYNQARAQFDDQVTKIPQPTFEGLAAPAADSLQRSMQRNVAKSQFDVDNWVNAARKDDFKAQFGAGLDKLGKLAGMQGADIDSINQQAEVFRPLGRSAGLPEAFIDKSLQDFKDRNWFNQATQRSMESKDDMEALQGLEHDLTDKDGFYAGKLDTDKRNAILRGVINDQLLLQNRLDHQQDKREAQAGRAIAQIDEQISSGIPATPAMWDDWQSKIKGTSYEPDFEARQNDEQTVQDVLRRPVDQQVNYVQRLAADLEKNGGSLKDRANLIRLQTAVNQNVNLLQNNPLQFSANRNGTDVEAIDFGGLNTPDGQQKIGATIADRMATLKAMQQQYGSTVQQLPLLPQEASMLAGQMQNATPGQRAQFLVGLRDAFGDDHAFESAMHQIAPHSPVTAIAGTMVSRSSPAQTPVWFSNNFAPNLNDVERVLRGEALLNPAAAGKAAAAEEEKGRGAIHGMAMPPDGGAAGLRMAFAQAAGDMFRGRPQLGDAYYSVFKDAYASLLAEKGDMKGIGDSKLEQQALQIALGSRTSFNGQTYSVPPGMDPSRFEGYVENAVASGAKEMKASDKWMRGIRGYGLIEVGGLGSGRYVLTNGNTLIARPDGQGPFTIDLRNQYLPGATAAKSGATAGATPPDPMDKVAMARAAANQPQ